MNDKENTGRPIDSRKRVLVWAMVLVALAIVAYNQLTIFSIQPIGAIPEGRTLVMLRTGDLEFIDSADAVCERKKAGVSLFCRGAVLAVVGKSDAILLRLPYSRTLYLASTGGREYSQ